MSNKTAEEICKEKLFKAYSAEMAGLDINEDAEYTPPYWVIEAMQAHTTQRLTTVKEKIENLPKSESIQTVLSIIEEEQANE